MSGYNRPAERFAARVAFMLCDSEGIVHIKPWELDNEFRLILSERYYQFTLVGLEQLGLRKPSDEFRTAYNRDQFEDAEIGAGLWLTWVLDAPRQMHSSRSVHEAHNLLLGLAQRGQGWPQVNLERHKRDGHINGTVPEVAVASMRSLNLILKKRGNPESNHKARREKGPLWLRIGTVCCEIPDSLSLWNAISAAPSHCLPLTGDAKDQFIYQFARAVNTANRHWDALRRLGLAPPSWMKPEPWEEDGKMATLSVGQSLRMLDYVAHANAIAENAGRQAPDQDDFSSAWASKAVLKRMTFEEFAASRAGRVLLSSDPMQKFDEIDIEDTDDEPMELASQQELDMALADFGESGQFDDVDLAILKAVTLHTSLIDLHKSNPAVRLKFRKVGDLSAALVDLQARTLAFVRRDAQETLGA